MARNQKITREEAIQKICALFASHLSGLTAEEREARLAVFEKMISKASRGERAATSKRSRTSASLVSAQGRA
jgi:hypothetical protein